MIRRQPVSKRSVLALSPLPEEGAGCRFRISQYVPYLEAHGFEVTVAPFYTPEFFRIVYLRGRYVTKTRLFLARTVRRLAEALSPRHDLVFLYREALPIGPPVIAMLLTRLKRRPLVYDFDDAVFLANVSDANRLVRVVKFPEKVRAIIRSSAAVTAGNAYLADYATRHHRNVTVLPTVVDTSRWVPADDTVRRRVLRVGWIGTPSTASYLASLADVLRQVALVQPFTLRVAGAGDPVRFPGVSVENDRWTLAGEVALFNTCDIGVYPLPDDAWTRGKCGLKAIQFMACGVPVVAAPVGVNREIIQDGVNGFLAATPEEWTEKLGWLLADGSLREKLGRAGRETVVERYSLTAYAPVLARVLGTATGG